MIKTIQTWDLPNTVSKPNGYDMKTYPEATAENMLILMEKLNELTEELNKLKQ